MPVRPVEQYNTLFTGCRTAPSNLPLANPLELGQSFSYQWNLSPFHFAPGHSPAHPGRDAFLVRILDGPVVPRGPDKRLIDILTVVAYQLVVSELLPRIAYLTLMNLFLNISFTVMAASVVITPVVGALDKRERFDVGDRIDYQCRWIFPLTYFTLLLLLLLLLALGGAFGLV